MIDQLRVDCELAGLPVGSKLCRICMGQVFGPVKTDRYRALWGLPPLYGTAQDVQLRTIKPQEVHTQPKPKIRAQQPSGTRRKTGTRKQGHGGCGKSRATGRPRIHVKPGTDLHRPDDVSNILESSLIKPAEWIKGTHPQVRELPFREPIRHLLYHVYPKRNDVWRWNVRLLLPHLPLFNGRRIVAIAVDETTEDAESVKDAFQGGVVEFLVFRNNRQTWEMTSFLPLLAQVQTDDPDVVTFRAHTKGADRFGHDDRPHLRDWVELLYRVSLSDWGPVQAHLEVAAMTGACRKIDQFHKRRRLGKPTYSGSFYWFRNCYVFSREWSKVDNPRWGCESWPGRLFARDETRCLLVDDTKSMYDPSYWRRVVEPQYRAWQEGRHS
jgi:hypothetical protein